MNRRRGWLRPCEAPSDRARSRRRARRLDRACAASTLTDTVVETWTSGLLLDLTGGQGADRLVAAGIICAVTAATSAQPTRPMQKSTTRAHDGSARCTRCRRRGARPSGPITLGDAGATTPSRTRPSADARGQRRRRVGAGSKLPRRSPQLRQGRRHGRRGIGAGQGAPGRRLENGDVVTNVGVGVRILATRRSQQHRNVKRQLHLVLRAAGEERQRLGRLGEHVGDPVDSPAPSAIRSRLDEGILIRVICRMAATPQLVHQR